MSPNFTVYQPIFFEKQENNMPSPVLPPPTSAFQQVTSAGTDLVNLIPGVWNLPQEERVVEPSDALLDYYKGQLILIDAYRLKLQKNEEILAFIEFVKVKANSTKSKLIQAVETHYAEIGPALHAITVAVNFWLFISIEDWDEKQTLEQYIQSLFQKSSGLSDAPSFSLTFNIDNLRKVGGFQICWTERLENHLSLSLNDEHKELKIFHLSSFLELCKHSKDRYDRSIPKKSHFREVLCTNRSQFYLPTRLLGRDFTYTVAADPKIQFKVPAVDS